MELKTISQVSKDYGISTRMLRYYEQTGLIKSSRKEGYAYRVYEENSLTRLRQIIILRKLRVPVKQIVSIINNAEAAETVEIFRQNISRLDNEITALSTVKSILMRFVEEINEKTDVKLKLLGDDAMFSVISSLSFSDNQIKTTKENLSMEELNKANEDLMKLEDKDVRIVYLPPMTIAAAYASGEGSEGEAGGMINRFVKESGLLKVKPDARSFGFDCSKGAAKIGENSHVYEMWVSVPDDMEIPAPLIRREFGGGLYAAHVLRAWDFQDWRRLKEWVNESDKYDNDWGSPRWESPETEFGQGLEEVLNFYNYIETHNSEMNYMQLDLLFPIKEKKKASFILNGGIDYASYSVDMGSINKNFKHQYDEDKYNLPNNLSLADYNSVIVNGISADGNTAVKFYNVSGNEAFVMYNNKSETNADWTYHLNAEDKNNIIKTIGIMSQDTKKYSAAIHSITFKK